MRRSTGWILLFCFLALTPSIAKSQPTAPSTTNNDASCDISALPAATLLLPYFEVDLNSNGESTLFTITNVTQRSQIARVTIWTDRAYPVFSFDVFLTGYDVQPISIRDILAAGKIAPPLGTSSSAFPGDRSVKENPRLDMSKCGEILRQIPPQILADLQSALTTGRVAACGNAQIGGVHPAGKAIGYVTVDLVRDCDATMPSDPGYFTTELLYDNVLIGDYQQIDIGRSSAQAGTMVHIRAITEGADAAPSFDRTFYSRLQNGGTADRRQPLPSAFAARWISAGSGNFDTSYKIWHEASVSGSTACNSIAATSTISELVRFDEDENATTWLRDIGIPPPPPPFPALPVSSRVRASDTSIFPPNPGGDVGGWVYLNLDAADLQTNPATQNWAIVSMTAEGRFSVDFDATLLGNGCTPAAWPVTDETGGDPAIGPAPNDNPAPQSAIAATNDNDDSCDITQAPAATLLLPYFEADVLNFSDNDTLFTITNVSRFPQIARVTIWTDRSYPVLTFNVFLTGYDVQALSVRDLLVQGIIAPPSGTSSATDPGARSAANGANSLLDLTNCDRLPVTIPPSILANVRSALTTGLVQECVALRVGNIQADSRARGYVTVDVVDNCGPTLPIEQSYFTDDLLYDNVLNGDYQRIDREGNFAQSSAMVHIRAIPEGGTQGSATTSFERTFYSRLQFGGTSDRRQPLPATFAARWIRDDLMDTSFVIWREGITRPDAGCIVQPNAQMAIEDLVRFDEGENPVVSSSFCPFFPCPAEWLPVSSRVSAANTTIFPPNPGGDVGGWMYLNLHYADVISRPVDVPAQNWVVVSMAAAGRFSGDFDAPALGNGCSPPAGVTGESGQPPAIGPAPNGSE